MLTTPSWNMSFQDLYHISGPVSDLLTKQARPTSVRKGTVIFGTDIPAENLLLLISGTVRVQQCIETGREVVLYRLDSNESCVLTAACLLAFEDYSAMCLAETDVDAMLLPRVAFDELMMTSPQFRSVVFKAYSKRIINLFTEIDEIALKQGRCSVAQKQFGQANAQNAQRKAFH